MYSLAPYRVTVEVNHESVALWSTDGKEGLAKWLYNYLESHLGQIQPRPDKRVARVSRVSSNSDFTFLSGWYQTGEYGFSSELIDSKSNLVSHQRTIEEAELIPFFYSFASQKQSQWAVLTLQKFKNLGIHDFLVPFLIKDFESAHPGSKLIVERLVPSTLMNTLLEGSEIKAVRFVQHSLPTSVEDSLTGTGYGINVNEVELVLRAKRNGSLPMLTGFKDIVSGTKNLSEVVTIPNWDYDAIKLEVEYAGKRRIVDLGKPYKINPNIDISEEVNPDTNGHPEWAQILESSVNFSSELVSTAGIDVQFEKEMVNNNIATSLQFAPIVNNHMEVIDSLSPLNEATITHNIALPAPSNTSTN